MTSYKQPVSINGLQFDALLEEQYQMEAESPEYVVESGVTIGDHIIQKSEKLEMKLFVSDMPVTYRDRFGNGAGRVQAICSALKALYYAKTLVSVSTSQSSYSNMAIESLTIGRTNEIGYAMEIPITLKRIRVTAAATTSIPATYGKSGATGSAAGSANTKKGSSGSSGGSSSASSGSGSGSSSSSSKSGAGGGTLLYNLAKKVGIIGEK